MRASANFGAQLVGLLMVSFVFLFINIMDIISLNYIVTFPANIRLDEDVLKTSFVFVFRRRLQDVLIKTNMFVLALRLQKTSWRRLGQDQYIRLGYTSSRRLQDVFKTSSRHLQDVFKTSSRPLQGVFKTSSRRFEDVFKMSSRHLQDVLQRYLQDVFKAYHQVNLF